MDTTRPPPPGGGGRNPNNRGRKPKNKRTRRNNNGSNTKRHGDRSASIANKRSKGPPAPPQTKLVVRNIGNVDKHGTVAQILDMVRTMVDSVNHKFVVQHRSALQLDQASMDMLLEEEMAVLKAQELLKAENEAAAAAAAATATEQEVNEETGGGDGQNDEDTTTDQLLLATVDAKEDTTANNNNKEDDTIADIKMDWAKAAAFVPHSDASTVSTTSISAAGTLALRLVYVVPPKKTRRRGEKPGCAYLVLSAPRIEPKEPPIVAASSLAKGLVKGGDTSKTEQGETKVAEEAAPAPAADTAQPQNANPSTVVKHAVVVAAPDPPPPVDYSRDIAKGRLLLLQAIEALSEHAKENAKADQSYAGSMVEVAMSGKTYRQQNYRRDRREGTLETSADYKNFLAKLVQDKEDRLARPKPAPGGGAVVGATDADQSGQPVAALVEHIRKKHAEASKRKKAKKKAKDGPSKDNGNTNGGNKSRKKRGKDGNKNSEEGGGKKGGGRNANNNRDINKDGKRGKRGKKKKVAGKGGAATGNAANAAPTLLKPGDGGGTSAVALSLPGINGGMGGFQGFG